MKQSIWLGTMLVVSLVLLGSPSAWAQDMGEIDAPGLHKAVQEAYGKVVVVNFWATWCAPCRQELPELMQLRRDIPEEDMLLLGVSLDFDQDALKLYTREKQLNYPQYFAAQDVGTIFEVDGIPKMMVWDREGKLSISHIGLMPFDIFRESLDKLITP